MFKFLIDTLEGEVLIGNLEDVGPCYPDDDVIYLNSIPCRLSSARPIIENQYKVNIKNPITKRIKKFKSDGEKNRTIQNYIDALKRFIYFEEPARNKSLFLTIAYLAARDLIMEFDPDVLPYWIIAIANSQFISLEEIFGDIQSELIKK